MIDVKPLNLDSRNQISDFAGRYPPEISELTFTNLFVWRHSRPVFFTCLLDSLVFLVHGKGQGDYPDIVLGAPLGGASAGEVARAFAGDIAGFVRVPEAAAMDLKAAGFTIEPDRDNADYVYRVKDLAELAGRRYAKKRNLVKQCLEVYECRYERVEADVVSECADMQDRWCRARRCGQTPGLCREYVAVRESFSHWKTLGLVGGAVRINGRIEAFAIGEALRPDTAVCHFEKAMPGFQGLGQLINQWFARYALEGFEFENREQDLGIAGLRQAKKSYHPAHMVEKYTAWGPWSRPQALKVVEPHACAEHGAFNA